MIAHAQKPDLVFRRNGRVNLNRRGRQFIRLLAAELCASAVVMLDTPCCEVVWRVLATHSIRQFPLHFPSRASPYAITFHLDSTINRVCNNNFFLFDYHCVHVGPISESLISWTWQQCFWDTHCPHLRKRQCVLKRKYWCTTCCYTPHCYDVRFYRSGNLRSYTKQYFM